MQFHLFVYYIFLLTTTVVSSWDLLPLGISNSYRLECVSLYFIRAFLCIRVSSNNTFPTLIESTWPENLLAIRPKIFPNENAHAKNERECNKILKAKWTEVDEYGRLWMFDSGSDDCNAKIFIFDLIQKNKEIFRTNCMGFQGDEATMMKIDTSSSPHGFYTVYFTLNHGRYLTIFDLKNKMWRKVKTSTGQGWNSRTIFTHELAFTLDSRAYLADKNGNLFITHIGNLKNGTELHATALGNLLGTSKGLITDPLGVLYYILPKDGAVVRWEPSRTLNAEGHDILHFQSIPMIQVLFGIQGSVWVATQHVQASRDHCFKILYHFSLSLE